MILLKKYLSEKNEFRITLTQRSVYKKEFASKDYQGNNSYNNCTNNGDNEMLNIKSEIDCRDNVHIKNRQNCDNVKSCQKLSK